MGEGPVNTEDCLSADLIGAFKESMGLKNMDPLNYSSLGLAYIGDTVYEVLNRTLTLSKGNRQVQKLHKECSSRANAGAQTRVYEKIAGLLTEEEEAVFKRARNTEVYTKAKNATTAEYHTATGLEALIGHLFLKGEYVRIAELLTAGWKEENDRK